ncbi:MAG: hypothetical protein IPN76_34295 [Saprospiraceae bacterium]|nr:hypothetical protein [Saprospiraceae bacterium]
MTCVKNLFFLTFIIVSISSAAGQDRFTNCAAAYLDSKLVVNDYSPEGYCELSKSASGELTVQTMSDLVPIGKINFKLAIRDGNSKTLMSYSNKTYQEVDIKPLLAKCKPGDAIVLLTLDDRYALPHNEILVK